LKFYGAVSLIELILEYRVAWRRFAGRKSYKQVIK